MKGFRTIAMGLLMAVAPVALSNLAGIDWKQYLPPEYAPIVAGLIMVVMRLVTTGPVPVGKSATSALVFFGLLFIAAGSLSGCAAISNIEAAATGKQPITMRQVYEVEASYDALFLTPASHYRALGICAAGLKSTVARPCADRDVVAQLQKADKQVDSALVALKAFLVEHPSGTELGTAGLYDAVTAAIAQAKSVIAAYSIK